MAALGRKRLDARLPPLGSLVRDSITAYAFRGGLNGVLIGFSRGFSRFTLPQISFHHFSTLVSFISLPCDGTSCVISRHPYYSQIFKYRGFISSLPSTGRVSDTSRRDVLFIYEFLHRISEIGLRFEG